MSPIEESDEALVWLLPALQILQSIYGSEVFRKRPWSALDICMGG